MKLLSPSTIGPFTVKNRLVFLPFYPAYADENGMITPQNIEHYKKAAKSGVGMLVVEASGIRDLFPSPFNIQCFDKKHLPGLKKLANTIKAEGAVAIIQLNHTGRYRGLTGSFAPSSIETFGVIPKEMTKQDLNSVKEAFVEAALIAKEAGFDGVELHGGTGYLLASFLSPLSNIRKDEYGGSIENRARFPVEVAAAVRENVGPDYPVGYRFMVREYLPGGLTLEEGITAGKMIARALKPAYFSVTVGSHSCLAYMAEQKNKFGQGFMLPEAEAVKKAIPDLSVIAAGHLIEPEYCEKALNEGKADAIGLGRVLFADFDWVRKAEGRMKEDIASCLLCDNCVRQISCGKPAFCVRWSKKERDEILDSFPEERTKKD